jgi:hypothetical protein
MTEYVNVRASEILSQRELVAFLKTRFPHIARPVGRTVVEGTECVEVSVPAESAEFEEIREFIDARRRQGLHGYSDFTIGHYLRKYTKAELQQAELLRLNIIAHFEPCGEECGTIYETLCDHCNLARQISELILDVRRVPQHKDVCETIAWVEWVVSARFTEIFAEEKLSGAVFKPIFEFKNPTKQSQAWHQLWVTGRAGKLSKATRLGKDPFSPSQVSWYCPLGHSVVTQFLSEIHLDRNGWDGSDITVTSDLFGQGQNLLRPMPLIIVSQRMYRTLERAGLKGFSCEIVHLD